MYADQLAQPGVYQISNSLDQAVADPQKTKKAINSAYATAQFFYAEKILPRCHRPERLVEHAADEEQLFLLSFGEHERLLDEAAYRCRHSSPSPRYRHRGRK